MTCVCEDIDHCYIEAFILERASCTPEEAINYHDVMKEAQDRRSHEQDA